MDKIKSLTDIHLFADQLTLRFNGILPGNVNVNVDMFTDDWVELTKRMNDLPMIYRIDSGLVMIPGEITYIYNSIKFTIKLKQI